MNTSPKPTSPFNMYTVDVTTATEIDLMAIPYKNWPERARQIAGSILARQKLRRDFYEQLPELRKSWLVAKLSVHGQFDRDLFDI